jgi:hypothetical protein
MAFKITISSKFNSDQSQASNSISTLSVYQVSIKNEVAFKITIGCVIDQIVILIK